MLPQRAQNAHLARVHPLYRPHPRVTQDAAGVAQGRRAGDGLVQRKVQEVQDNILYTEVATQEGGKVQEVCPVLLVLLKRKGRMRMGE